MYFSVSANKTCNCDSIVTNTITVLSGTFRTSAEAREAHDSSLSLRSLSFCFTEKPKPTMKVDCYGTNAWQILQDHTQGNISAINLNTATPAIVIAEDGLYMLGMQVALNTPVNGWYHIFLTNPSGVRYVVIDLPGPQGILITTASSMAYLTAGTVVEWYPYYGALDLTSSVNRNQFWVARM